MKKYKAVLKTSLQCAFEYRAEGFIWFLTDVTPSLAILFFWYAAFKTRDIISGYTLPLMTAYYLGMLLMRTLSTPHPEGPMIRHVMEGTLNIILIRPLSITGMWFFWEIAYKIARLIYIFPLFIIIFFAFNYFNLPMAAISITQLFYFSLGLLFSFFLQFIIRFTISLASFWVTDPWGVFSLFEMAITLLSGALLPLDLLPKPFVFISSILPFKYFYFFPLETLLGRVQGITIISAFFIQIFWLIISAVLLRFIMSRGLKNYSAFGG